MPEGPSLTEQAHLNDADVNTIIARHRKTGQVPIFTGKQPTYGDFSGVVDFQDSLNRIAQAEQDFMSLPSKIRNKFKNDPGQLIEFVNDPANEQECYELGLIPYPDDYVPPAAPEEPVGSVGEQVKPQQETVVQPDAGM